MSQNVLKEDNMKIRFPNRPETKATNLLLSQLDKLYKKEYIPKSCSSLEDTLKSPDRKPSGNTPSPRRTRKTKLKPQSNTLNCWLSKSTPIEELVSKKKTGNKSNLENQKVDRNGPCSTFSAKLSKIKSDRPKFTRNSSNESFSDLPVFSMDGTCSAYKTESSKIKSDRPKFTRNSSNESFSDLPVFITKSTKKPNKKNKHDKYRGLPQLKDILEEQNNLIEYRKQVIEAQTLEEPTTSFQVVPSSPKKKKYLNLLLDCKSITLVELTKAFQENVKYLEDIINGKKYNERHNRFQSNNNKYNQTTNDLIYNTSMIVFSYEQIEHMTSLMEEQFDPEDNMSSYFFKVLLPELCLKIFMEHHNMNRREATAYLENRPVD